MRIVILFLCISVSICYTDVSAQQFVNGGLEPANGTLLTCSSITESDYNTNMGGSFVLADGVELNNAGCNEGTPVEGSYFVKMIYDVISNPSPNTLIFKLDQPLTPNQQYSFTINYKIPTGLATTTGTLVYGYAKDSVSTDSISGSVSPITNEDWEKDTLTFTPTEPWQFIWVRVSALMGDPFELHVDDLEMLNGGTSISQVEKSSNLSIQPNPFRGSTVLKLTNDVSIPYDVEVLDITGKQVLLEKNLNQRSLKINLEDMPKGMYLLRLTDGDHKKQMLQLIAR